jgi:hypothetical protein
MRTRIAGFVAALVLGGAALATAQFAGETGTVVRLDPQSSVVMLDDGRMYRVTPRTVFLVDDRPIGFGHLRPGERVVIQYGEPVIYREGRYVALPAPPVVAQAPPVVAQAPPPVPVTAVPVAVPAGIRQTIYGTIDDIDRDGKVKIRTDRDSFEARISQDAARQVKKGDTVVIDMTIAPPGTPGASPR